MIQILQKSLDRIAHDVRLGYTAPFRQVFKPVRLFRLEVHDERHARTLRLSIRTSRLLRFSRHEILRGVNTCIHVH